MQNGYVGSHFESNITKLHSFSIYTCNYYNINVGHIKDAWQDFRYLEVMYIYIVFIYVCVFIYYYNTLFLND